MVFRPGATAHRKDSGRAGPRGTAPFPGGAASEGGPRLSCGSFAPPAEHAGSGERACPVGSPSIRTIKLAKSVNVAMSPLSLMLSLDHFLFHVFLEAEFSLVFFGVDLESMVFEWFSSLVKNIYGYTRSTC